MDQTSGAVNVRTLSRDNAWGVVFLLLLVFLSCATIYLLVLGAVLFLMGLPMVLMMLPLSYAALAFRNETTIRRIWWFISTLIAWISGPLLAHALYPWLNSIQANPASMSPANDPLVLTKWLWSAPFLVLYLLIGLARVRKQRRTLPKADPALAQANALCSNRRKQA